jgi:hypothetical protein
MSLWSTFTDTLKGIAQLPGALVGNVLSSGAQMGTSQLYKGQPEVAAAAGLAAEKATVKSLNKAGISTTQDTVKKVIDPVLIAGEKAEKYVFSPLVARPISTAFLLTDPTSKLYQEGEFGKGFQLSDVTDAYNRSEKVSLGVSATKSLLAGALGFGTLESAILENGGIDLSKVDLWNDKDIKANFTDNTLGKYVTGITDFVVKNVAIAGAGGAAGAVSKSALLKAGLNTNFRVGDFNAIPKFEKDINDHIKFRETNGAEGNLTVIGTDIENLANTTDVITIKNIAKKHSLNPRIVKLIQDTQDSAVVRDFVLADKGYGPALERLASANRRDDLWYLGDGNAEIQAYYIENGKLPNFTTDQRARWTAAFDDAIKKDPKQQDIFDAFLREDAVEGPLLPGQKPMTEVSPLMFGKNYKPAEPIIGARAYAASRTRAGQLKVAALQRDFSNVGGISQKILSSNVVGGPTTVLMRTFGTMMPKGFVTNSGLRPLNGIDELIAVVDDVPLFTRGDNLITIAPGEQITVSQMRTSMLDRFVNAKTDGERELVIKSINKELARTIAFTRGYYDTVKIDSFVDSLMENVYATHGNLRQKGYAMDPTGVRVQVDIKTQRQLANSLPMLPFGELDRMIARTARMEKNRLTGSVQQAAGATRDATRSVFELGNKAFSLAQLYRFSYIPKNSVFEPLLSATLAQGSEFTGAFLGQAQKQLIKNAANFTMRNIEKSKTIFPSAKKEIQKEIRALSEQYNQAIINRDITYANYERFFSDTPGVSPKTKLEYADEVKAELRTAEKVVSNIENNLNKYTIEYGKPIDVPSLYNLRRRVETLKAQKDPRFGVDIANAEAAIAKASQDINTLTPELNAATKAVENAYANIGKVLEDLDPKLKQRADLLSVAEKRYEKKPLLPDTIKRTLTNGQTVEFPSVMNENYLGDGYFSEIANTSTRTIEVLGNQATVAKISTLFKNGPKTITNVADPVYFDELAFVVNNHMRGDILIDQILKGATREELLQWSTTNQAKSYARNMGQTADKLTEIVDESISYVNRYLPTQGARTLAATGNVRVTDLSRELSGFLDQMVPIQPLDVPYGKPTNLAKSIEEATNSLMSKAWTTLAKPENMIREVWGTVEHANRTIAKAELLVSQGQEVTFNNLIAMRQAAASEMVAEVSKVFYTIPRQQRGLYLARAITTFPNAAASGIYRYGRFAVKQPKRVAGFLNSYYGLYNSFGVDRNGEPVENPMDAEYLLIPGSKELGFNNGKGIIMSARGTNFLANLPGPQFLIPVAIGQLFNWKPNVQDELKSVVDKTIGKIPGYSWDEVFPYGVEANLNKQLKSTFTPAWYRNIQTAMTQSNTDKQWMDSYLSESNKQWIMYEMGIGKMPTPESVRDGAKGMFLRKARTQFFSILGTPQYVENLPDRVYQDYYYALVEKWKTKVDPKTQKPYSINDIYKYSEQEFQGQMATAGSKEFPMDRLFVSGRNRPYIQPSQKSYDRIWSDFSGLAKELESISPDVVSLLTADLPPDYNPQINKFLNDPNSALPGGTMLSSQLKTPQMVENELEKSRFWKAYIDFKDALNKAATAPNVGYASYRSVPELVAQLKDYAYNTLGAASKIWLDDYITGGTGKDKAVSTVLGLEAITKNTKFMTKFGETQFWTHAKTFVQYRDSFVKAYADAPSGYKSAVQEQWTTYLEESLSLWDPVLQNIINRNFVNDKLTSTTFKLKETK